MVEVPSQEIHERFLRNGLTKYSLEVITQVLGDYKDCEQDYTQLVIDAMFLIGDYDKVPGCMKFAPEPFQKLYALLDTSFIPHISLAARNSREHWPVAGWQKAIQRYRSLNKKIRNAIEVAKAAPPQVELYMCPCEQAADFGGDHGKHCFSVFVQGTGTCEHAHISHFSAFTLVHHREPTETEIAEALGE